MDVLDYTCKCILNTIYYVGSNFGLLDQSESVFKTFSSSEQQTLTELD